MKRIIILINKFIYAIGKRLNRGSSLPGKIALKLDKNILKKIKLPEDIIMITGSNGKTSTTEMVCSILENNGYKVGTNKKGSNQIAGITTTILNSCNFSGVVQKDALVMEVDERYLKEVTKYIKPKYLAITNIYRDQMTRNGHPEFIYNEIKKAITEDIHLILNTDDPLSSMYGYKKENVTYFGINETDLDIKENTSAYNDAKYCPNCKELLKYEYYHFSHIGKYECTKCDHKRHEPQFAITSIDLQNGQITINEKYNMKMNLKSTYNAYNTILSFTIASLIGIEGEKIIEVLNNYLIKNDRVQTFELNLNKGMLLTSKHENSISYNQSLQYIVKENKPCTVVIIIDAVSRKYFTSETSWIWDIDFELLKSDCVKTIVLAGRYVNDLIIRFKNIENLEQSKIIAKENLDEMMECVKGLENENIYVITCFSDRMKFMNRR